MTLLSDQAFAAVIAAAAPFSDRLAGTWFVTEEAADPATVDAWITAVTGDRPEAIEPVLHVLGLTRDDLERGLAPVRLREVGDVHTANVPPWATALRRLLAACNAPIDPTVAVPMGPVYADVWRHLIAAGRTLATEPSLRWPVQLAPDAIDALADALAQRAIKAVVRAIEPEAMAARTLGLPPDVGLPGDEAAWWARLEELPGLAFSLGTAAADWFAFMEVLAHRLGEDLPAILSMTNRTTPPTVLERIRCDAGDPHEGGQSVALLSFDGDVRVAYKPKPQDGAVAFSRLATTLNSHRSLQAAEIVLPTRGHLAREGYGWDEVIQAGPSEGDDIDQWARCYGAWLGLLEVLEARDMWLDNVVLAGSLPHLIDVETMLQPRNTGSTRADHLLGETIWPTGAVTCLTRLPDGDVEDIGTITPPRILRLPFSGSDFGDREAENVALDGVVRWALPAWRPAGGDEASLTHSIFAGYDAMDEALNDPALRDAVLGGIEELAAAPGRVVLRSTFSCYRILHDSLSPGALDDGCRREVHLAVLMRHGARLLLSDDPTERAYAERAVLLGSADRAALERLDIPLVRYDPRTSAVTLADGTTIEDWFEGAPLDRARERLASRSTTAHLRRAVLRLAIKLAAAADKDRAHRTALLEQCESSLVELLVEAGATPSEARAALQAVRA